MIEVIKFVIGRAGTGKSYTAREQLLDWALSGEKNLLLIVPENQLEAAEKAVFRHLGKDFFPYVKINTFRGLLPMFWPEKARRPLLNASLRKLFMTRAVCEVQGKLEVFAACKPTDLADLIVAAQVEFAENGITLDRFEHFSSQLAGGILKKKLTDICKILAEFNSLLEEKFEDSIYYLPKIYELLKNELANFCVCVDGFDSPSFWELHLQTKIIANSKNFFATFCTDAQEFSRAKNSIFSKSNEALRTLTHVAKTLKINSVEKIFLETAHRFKNDNLKSLEKIFLGKIDNLPNMLNEVHCFEAANKFEEANFAAQTVAKLVYEKTFDYKDFEIKCDPEAYRLPVERAFKPLNIPISAYEKANFLAEPLVAFVCQTLNVLHKKFIIEEVLNYGAFQFSGASSSEISLLKKFVSSLRLEKKSALKGFSLKNSRDSKVSSANNVLKKLVAPLLPLADAQIAAQYSCGLYELFQKLSLKEALLKTSNEFRKMQQEIFAKRQIHMWNVVISVLDNIHEIFGEEKLSPLQFAELFLCAVASQPFEKHPKTANEVQFSRETCGKPKVVIILGASSESFPGAWQPNGLFSAQELQQLSKIGLASAQEHDNLLCIKTYRSLTAASSKVFLCWQKMTFSGEMLKSPKIIKKIFKLSTKLKLENQNFRKLNTKIFPLEPAIYSSSKKKEEFLKFLKRALCYPQIEFYCENLLPQNNCLRLSPSQLESYFRCPFAYFLKYLLNVKLDNPRDFGGLELGNLLHFVLEQIFSKNAPNEVKNWSETQLDAVLSEKIFKWASQEYEGLETLPARMRYFILRSTKIAAICVRHVAEELSQSRFRPRFFEEKLDGKNNINPFFVRNSRIIIEITGKIDRVDVMDLRGAEFVRVIDYKSAPMKISFEKLSEGIGMQTLLYLYAVFQSRKSAGAFPVPAGALCVPVVAKASTIERNLSGAEKQKILHKNFRMTGLLLADKQAIVGMEPAENGEFCPAIMKNGEARPPEMVVSFSQMMNLFDFLEKKVLKMAQTLRYGEIFVKPTPTLKNVCNYCESRTICGLRADNNFKSEAESKEEFFVKFHNSKEDA